MNDNTVTAQVSSTQWTDEQTRAMELRGGNVLVSASAGSGKTAVLTERLLRMIVEGGADVRDFVVVTFTKAAAAEMKARLGKKLSDYSRSHPEDARVKCQLMYLPDANISAIDSFCLALLEKYQSAESADYSPGVRILSENEAKLIFKKALSEVIEEEYDRGEDGFYALTDALSGEGGGIESLKKAVTSLHYISAASPESETLKDEYLAAYGADYPAAMLRFALENVAEAAEYHARAMNGVLAEAPIVTEDTPPKEKDTLRECVCWLTELADSARSVAEAARAGDHARCAELMSVDFRKADSKPSNTPNPWYDRRKDVGNRYKNFMESAAVTLNAAGRGLADEAAELREIVSRLFDLTQAVEERYAALKKDRGAWDFADIEKKALKLLWKRGEDGVLRRTDVSLEEGARYKEILIDEYQDVNMLQERIFLGICARDEDNEAENNVFTVGDIKQSIYGFRGATPELFRRRRASYLPATPEDAEFPAKIVLNRNFRSRKSILDAVNAVFGAIMTEETCGIDYAEDAMKKLDGAAERGNPGSGAYLTLLSDPDERGEYVAAKIAELMRSGMKVVEGRGANRTERDLRYGDIAILMRSVKHKYCKPYLDAFEAAGIPCADPGSAGCFDVPSVRGVISVLRAIDNPMKDVSLVAAMVSHVFGFTESELMRVRGGDKGVFYYSVKAAAEAGDAKCSAFLARLERLRRKAAVLTADKLIWYIYSSSGCLAFASSLKTGKRDRAALMRFYESAKAYGASGRQDLSGFIGFVDRMIEEESDSDGGYVSGAGDEVRIMTVHKSKGLEFPVCFICGVESQFSKTDQDLRQRFVVDPDIGVAAGIVRPSEHKKLDTAAFRAAKEKLRLKKRMEDIRVLYVAMTRACERLEIVSSVKDPDALCEDAPHRLDAAGRMDAYDVKNAPRSLDWIVPAAVCSDSFTVSVDPSYEAAPDASGAEPPAPDAALADRIFANVTGEYGFAASAGVPTKLTVSEIVAIRAGKSGGDRCCERRPACLDADKRGGTEAGTATHAFLQFADYDALDDPEAELARLVSQRFITERQAELVDRRKLDNFIGSELLARIRAAESSTREFRFTFEAAASDFIPGAPDEKLLVQGAIDCVFEEDGRCVVVDYKTDRIKDDIAEKVAYYRPQLEIYARGLRELTGKEVSEGILFFLDTGEAVKVW